jgi:hypothetical protein
MNKRPFSDRVLDRIWTLAGDWMQDTTPPASALIPEGDETSISGTMAWPLACQALASGACSSKRFRRRRSVREVVETLAPTDGRHFARWIVARHPQCLTNPEFLRLNDWGDPIQAPGFVLGTSRPYSPTALRHLAHALWLSGHQMVRPGETVIEIGVGFGGLASMNWHVGQSPTHPVDLPPVINAARLMLAETGNVGALASEPADGEPYSVISCYAFSELNRMLQDEYFDRYIRNSRRGMIVSNAAMFSQSIGGRSDEALVAWFRSQGIPASATSQCDLLSPADIACKVTLIHWNRDEYQEPA